MTSDSEKVAKLAKLAGTLRYAVEGNDRLLIDDTRDEMTRIANHLSPNYRTEELLIAAQAPGPDGGTLLSLYVDRCYRLAAEDYGALESLDQEIARLTPSQTDPTPFLRPLGSLAPVVLRLSLLGERPQPLESIFAQQRRVVDLSLVAEGSL